MTARTASPQSTSFPTTAELTASLRRLSEVDGGELPVLSVYLDMRAHATGQAPGRRAGLVVLRDRLREIERTHWPRGADYDSFKADEERIRRFLDDEFDEAAHGLAIFACSGIGLWEAIHVGVPFHDSVSAGPLPDLFQLARLIDTHEAAVVAVVDSNTARLFVTRTGRLEEVPGPDEDSVSFRKRSLGGWSEQRYQRHIDKHIAQFAKEAAAAIEDLVAREGARRLVLAGDEVAITPLDGEMSKALKDNLDEIVRVDMRTSRDELDDQIRHALERAEADSGRSVADRLIGAVRGGGLGVTGVEATRQALEAGAVEVLVLTELPGAAPDETDYHDARDLGEQAEDMAEHEPGVLDLEIRNELVRLAAATSAEVEVVADHEGLVRVGGVGALLRYRA
ncbi:MAG TPA: Vms1/Ankzf1 family peptidyl-tRNA hydrolase [Candidatus Limnocylindria bacterium]|nr:Vms1/Ankzf1 family peptidyl-tRNA hydrolase [Candidatus Limnocylindria bacterium]